MADIIYILGAIAIASITLVFYLLKKGTQKFFNDDLPGPKPSDPSSGNMKDIQQAGGYHPYLLGLHRQYGDIVSFWLGQQRVVSIASPELLKQTRNLSEKPAQLLEPFEPFTSRKGMFYANGARARELRRRYDHAFSHTNIHNRMILVFDEVAKKVCANLSESMAGEKELGVPVVPLGKKISLRTILRAVIGETFKDWEIIERFEKEYDMALGLMDRRFAEGDLDGSFPGEKELDTHIKEIMKYLQDAVDQRRANPPEKGEEILIDLIMQEYSSDEIICRDLFTYVVGGFHTSGVFLSWCIFYLSKNKSMQDQIYEEIIKILCDVKGNMDISKIDELIYMKQFLDETLRCSSVVTIAVRMSDEDITLGNYVIPSKTPIVQELGVLFKNDTLWDNPSEFNPDRFSPEKRANLPRYSFEPFGFAGYRKCPGYRFANFEPAVTLANLLFNFEVTTDDGDYVTTQRNFGYLETLSDGINVTWKKRIKN